MATFSKEFLSGSTNGRPINVTNTGSPGNTIHTAHATAKDELHIYAVNLSGADVRLTIEFGGTGTSDRIEVDVQKNAGALLVIPGAILTNSLVVGAYAATTAVINVFGWVNRITP